MTRFSVVWRWPKGVFCAAWRWCAEQGLIAAAFVILSVSVLLSAIYQISDEVNEARHDDAQTASLREQERVNERLRTQVDRFQFELDCRFELTQPLAELQAAKADALAAGLVALVREDEAELLRQIARIDQARAEEQAALEQRSDAVATCSQRAEDVYG